MKRLVSLIAVAAVAGGVANASKFKTACTRGNDARVIEVVSPGQVGAACDVRYFRGSNRTPTTPFHADNSENFCLQKANELVNTLATAGYDCASTDSAIVAAAPSPTPVEPAAAPVVAEVPPVLDAAQEVVEQEVAIASPSVATPKASDLEDEMNAILSLPEQETASRGPSNLTDNAVDTLAGGQNSPVVGRIVGATPDAPAIVTETAPLAATPVTQAALRDDIVESEPAASLSAEPNAEPTLVTGPEPVASSAPTAPPTPAAQPAAKSANRSPMRTVEDIVRATLRAQTAAWNEGNLDAFMETYWKDDALKFVSGGEITKGWSATMKRYRERYADGNGLGQLGLGQMDVELVTDDVAVVTGRFTHTKDAAPTSGFFSLVMRRDRGAWRIVHDHTVVDSTPAE